MVSYKALNTIEEGLKDVIEKNRLDTNIEQLVLDLKQELGSYV